MSANTTAELFETGLQLLYAAHHQGARQAEANLQTASSSKLKKALHAGVAQNWKQAKRLEDIFHSIGISATQRHSSAMAGIADENSEMAAAAESAPERDLVHIGYGQLSAHFYLAEYGTARAYARSLGNKKAVSLLQKTLNETGALDRSLTGLAKHVRKAAGKESRRGNESGGFGSSLRTAGLLSLAAAAALIAQSGRENSTGAVRA